MRLTGEQIATLVRSPIGARLGESGVRAFTELCDPKKRSAGGRFFQEGDPAVGIYLILHGRVKLTRLTRDGRETLLHVAEAPSIIAEAAIFMGKYPATATAVVDSELLFLSKPAVFDLLERSGGFARWYMENLSIWVRRLVGRIEELTTSDASARLSRYLIDLYERTAPGLRLTAPRVTLPVSKGELARLLNMQLPSLSRIFRKMQDEGMIEVSGRTIVIRDVATLRRTTLPPLD